MERLFALRTTAYSAAHVRISASAPRPRNRRARLDETIDQRLRLKYLILSDIHANVDALDAVLQAATPGSWDRVLVLGDLVGYGAEPNAVIERVLALDPMATIRGNHDKAACWIEHAADFNHVARTAAALDE